MTALALALASWSRAVAEPEFNRLALAEYRDRLQGGFAGQMAGVVYGAPHEFHFEGSMAPEWMLTEFSAGLLRGGREEDGSGEAVLMIPAQSPKALPLERWPYDVPADAVALPETK